MILAYPIMLLTKSFTVLSPEIKLFLLFKQLLLNQQA